MTARALTRRLALAHTPTPLVCPHGVLEALGLGSRGIDLWVKRDDETGGAEAGNKIRKLEYLLAEAKRQGADTLVTCGGIQSNHARATAIVGRSLGMSAHLLLRTTEPEAPLPNVGNVFLDRMVGATVRAITPAQYRERGALMTEVAMELTRAGRAPYVIPEGGSNGLGALGYVRAMEEVRKQLDLGLGGGAPFDLIFHACGSGGTAAGVALGAAEYEVAAEVRALAVCDDRAYFEAAIARIVEEARALAPELTGLAKLVVDDAAKGPAYAVASSEQKKLIVTIARASGLMLDPVYTGKAFFGLVQAAERGELDRKRVLFLHTGGLPGLLAQSSDMLEAL